MSSEARVELPENTSLRSFIIETRLEEDGQEKLHEVSDDLQDDRRVRHVMFSEDSDGVQFRLTDGRVDVYESGEVQIVGQSVDGVWDAYEEANDIAYEYTGTRLREPEFVTAIALVEREYNIDSESVTASNIGADDIKRSDWMPKAVFDDYPDVEISVFPNGTIVIDGVSSIEELEELTEWAASTSFPRQ